MSPVARVLHYNPPGTKGYTACGRLLSKVKWTADEIDCTCNSCRSTKEWEAAVDATIAGSKP